VTDTIALRALLRRARAAGYEHITYGPAASVLAAREHLWKRDGDRISWYPGTLHIQTATGRKRSVQITDDEPDLEFLRVLLEALGLLPPERGNLPEYHADGTLPDPGDTDLYIGPLVTVTR
jgi:hypothetical protein